MFNVIVIAAIAIILLIWARRLVGNLIRAFFRMIDAIASFFGEIFRTIGTVGVVCLLVFVFARFIVWT